MRRRWTWLLVLLGSLNATAVLQAAETAPTVGATRADGEMMKRYLLGLVDQAAKQWQADYEKRTTPEQIAVWQKEMRDRLLDEIGGLPERGPLNARITGKIERDGYTVEKVIFESLPKFYVTGLLFLPDAAKFKPPYPGVVEPVGHSANGKSYTDYQSMGAFLALNGMAAIVFDTIDESERIQYHGERDPYLFDKNWGSHLHGTYGHEMVGIGSILLGRNSAQLQIWDTMRAIDYLQSRPEVDPKRIGCTGNSGGGILTAYMVALDDRVQAAAPSCYAENLPAELKTCGPQDAEHQTWASMTAGPQTTDMLMMRAPVPTLLCVATKDFFPIAGAWQTARMVKRLYSRMGFSERFDIIENDAPHNYNQLQRQAAARWLSRWLLAKDQPISEPAIKLLSDKEAQCTPEGQVMKLPGARSVYDLDEDYENQLAERRAAAWTNQDRGARLEQVRRLAGIRKVDELPMPQVEKGETTKRPGYRVEKLVIRPEKGIMLPASLFTADTGSSNRTIVYVHEGGGQRTDSFPGGPIEQLTLDGARVLAVDLRGTGLTQQTSPSKWALIGGDWTDVSLAYCLGRSYVGMRAEDILVAARYAAKEFAAPGAAVELIAVGNVGVPALHAAALEPSLFSSVKISETLVSWDSVIRCRLTLNQYVNVVQGALLEYDLPNLTALLGAKLTVEDAVDAMGRPVANK